jgi:ribosomal-protein-alanine acetyltransferase
VTVVFTPAGVEDVDEIFALERQIFPDDAWSKELVRSELEHPDSYYLQARDDSGQLVGYAGLRAPRVRGGQADIQTLGVAEGFRRQGVGQRLLDTLLAEARSRGIAEVFLEVRADNPGASALYEGTGFREIARRPGYYQPGSIDAIVMRCVPGGEARVGA